MFTGCVCGTSTGSPPAQWYLWRRWCGASRWGAAERAPATARSYDDMADLFSPLLSLCPSSMGTDVTGFSPRATQRQRHRGYLHICRGLFFQGSSQMLRRAEKHEHYRGNPRPLITLLILACAIAFYYYIRVCFPLMSLRLADACNIALRRLVYGVLVQRPVDPLVRCTSLPLCVSPETLSDLTCRWIWRAWSQSQALNFGFLGKTALISCLASLENSSAVDFGVVADAVWPPRRYKQQPVSPQRLCTGHR